MKVLGIILGLFGLATLVFAMLAWRELRGAAMSELAPSPDSLPLTKLVAPELFDTGNSGAKPAELAQIAFRRINLLGGAGLILGVAGILMLVLVTNRGRRSGRDSS